MPGNIASLSVFPRAIYPFHSLYIISNTIKRKLLVEMDSSASRDQDIVPREERVSEWYPISYLEPKPVPALSYALLILNQPIDRKNFSRYWEGCEYPLRGNCHS